MSANMRAKFFIESITQHSTVEVLKMRAVPKSSAYPEDGSDEDNTYAKVLSVSIARNHAREPSPQLES